MNPSQPGFNDASIGLDGTDLAKFDMTVPESLKFKMSKRGMAARRIPIKIRSELQQYSSNNNKLIRFFIPSSTILDARAGYITFNVTLSQTGGTYIRCHDGIMSIINRVRILWGATQCSDVRDWNRIYEALWQMFQRPAVTSAWGMMMGWGTQIDRNAAGASVSGTDYVLPLWSGILSGRLLPLSSVSGGMVLEMYIEDPSLCIECDGATPIITITNPVLHVERLELPTSYQTYIDNCIRKAGLQFGFHTWERYINQLMGGTQQNITIQHRSTSLNALLNFFVMTQELNDTTVNDKFIIWTTQNLATSQVLVNNFVYPDEPTDGTYCGFAEFYQQYCRYIAKWKLNGIIPLEPPISWAEFQGLAPFLTTTPQFIQVDDFEAYPEEMDIINPYSVLKNNTTILKKLVFSVAFAPNTIQLDTWAEYFQECKIETNGRVNLIQ